MIEKAVTSVAVPDVEELKLKLQTYNKRYKTALTKKIEIMNLRYQKCMASRVFKEPTSRIKDLYIELDKNIKELEKLITNKFKDSKTKSIELISKLDTLSPLKTLTRGYAIASLNEKIIKSIKDVKKDDIIDLRFVDGNVKTKTI